MQKNYPKLIFLSLAVPKQLKALYDLASFIESNQHGPNSSHFQKLSCYHNYLRDTESDLIKKINLEFVKIKSLDYQFQIYLMNLERFIGQSKKEYDFLVTTQDKEQPIRQNFPIVCILDSIRSAHNIGAMFRNAECFGVEKIYLTGLSPTPTNPQVQKTAMGTPDLQDWEYHKSAIQLTNNLKEQGYEIWSIETGNKAIDINSISIPPKKLALIFGHELHGVSLELLKLSDKMVQIPLKGHKNSLNVSVAQGVVLSRITSVF